MFKGSMCFFSLLMLVYRSVPGVFLLQTDWVPVVLWCGLERLKVLLEWIGDQNSSGK